MILQTLGRLITGPFRLIINIFRRSAVTSAKTSAKAGATAGAQGASGAVKTSTKTGGSVVAKTAAVELLDTEYREEPPSGLEAAMFKQLPRPRLTEKSASEMTIEQAQNYAVQARRFYDFRFPLFPRGDFFYEEIEEDFLTAALGYEEESIDQRYVDVTALFRRTLNANTRRILLYWAPLIGLFVFGGAAFAMQAGAFGGGDLNDPLVSIGAYFGAGALIAGFLTFLVYSWPYKVVQQRNLMNLDNYVTSKFARINNNFQVAKRRALNVERDKRMGEREELKDEAGAWTLAYHWFATRLFLCETMLRNKFYQVRRNTTLYWVGGLVLTALLLGGLGWELAREGLFAQHPASLLIYGGAALLYLILMGAVTARATGMMFRVLESNEWSRFHLVNLDRTIRDHVGEDKLQIVTFRDRNRFE